MTRLLVCCWLAAMLAGTTAIAADATPAQLELFEKQIRPLLVEHCLKCHGGESKIKGGLKLTSRQSILDGGESGPAAVPGKPADSLLVEAINHQGLKMPPDAKLADAQIARLTEWIQLGLPWPAGSPEITLNSGAADNGVYEPSEAQRKHWAFQPVTRPAAPAVQDAAWSKTDIDRFILAALERKALKPSAPADKRSLLRRATFDLIGLPPKPEEVDAFLKDESPEAFAKVVDRLLAAPQYGERWGRYWLDVARYADNRGYVFNEDTNFTWSYTYRDYVVRALNEDLPYDQFVREQLAADQLPLGADKRPLTALGYVTLGGIFLKNQHDIIDDRIDVITRGMLGLTVSCARCHNHKFDPIPTADYYSLYGVLASSIEPTTPPLFADPPATDQYTAFEKELRTREAALLKFAGDKYAELVKGARTRVAEYLLAAHAQRDKPKTDDFMLLADPGELNPMMIVYYQSYLERAQRTHHPVFVPWHALATLPEQGFAEAARAVISRLEKELDPTQPVNPLVLKALVEKPPASLAELAQRYSEVLLSVDKQWQETLARAAAGAAPPPTSLPDAAQEQLRLVFYGADAAANTPYDLYGLELFPDRAAQGERDKFLKAVVEWRITGPGAPPRAMALADAPVPNDPYIFVRGNPNNRGRSVPRQFLQILSGPERRPFQKGSGRLELAQAIASPTNPLTARVIVNRIWQYHFGSGLVHTASDFGLRSEPPTHPELLDHLASMFVENGWSIKKMHRAIMLSAVYQQQSAERPECRAVDPENNLLWRANRRRLDFEALRDAMLEVGGRLDRTIGGPPVSNIAAADSTRRTLYGYVDRRELPGLYRTFDFPSPDSSSPARDVTTVPQQALFLMNNQLVISAAQFLLARPEVAGAADKTLKLSQMYRLLYGREPDAEELLLAQDFLGDAPAIGVWRLYAQGLLLANEFVFVD